MSETDHERWSEDLAAYALGALAPAEAAALKSHLEGCERCRAELRWLEPAAGALPESVERIEPPPRLRARLMAEVEAESRAAERRAAPGAGHRLAAWLRGSGSAPVALRPAVGLAALALVVAALLGYAIGGDSGEGGSESTIVAGQAFGVTATMVDEGDGGTLRLANVHQLPDGKVLEAWVQRDGEVEAVPALFAPDHGGRASTQLPPMDGVEAVMVTAEPKGGSEKPTGEPLITIAVRQ
jgi:anti-sigma-K factor RskA